MSHIVSMLDVYTEFVPIQVVVKNEGDRNRITISVDHTYKSHRLLSQTLVKITNDYRIDKTELPKFFQKFFVDNGSKYSQRQVSYVLLIMSEYQIDVVLDKLFKFITSLLPDSEYVYQFYVSYF